MGDAEEKIRGFLKEIKANQKKLRVKISVILKKLEDYLFTTKPKLAEGQIKLILLGDSEQDQQGLLHLCGAKGRGLKGTFKKSAFYALKILLRLLEEYPQKEEIVTFFTDLEDDEFPIVKLGPHLAHADPEKNDETPFRVCRAIYEKRRFLNLDIYIDSKESQIKFAKWYEQFKNEGDKGHAEEKQATYANDKDVDDYQPGVDVEEEAAKKFANLTKKRRQNINEFDELNYDRDHEFFMKTFQDPMVTKEQAEEFSFAQALKGKKKKGRKKKGNKDVAIPFIADRDTAEYKGIIEQLHIDSEQFDPFILLETFHSKTPYELMVQAIDKIGDDIKNQSKYKEHLMIFYINEFAKCERILGRIQETFLVPEGNPSKGMTTDIITKIEDVHGKLMKTGEPIFLPKQQADKVRACLSIYDKFRHIVNWPEEMKKALMEKNIAPIIKNYQRYITWLKQYQDLPIFNEVYNEVTKLTKELHKQILDTITIKEKKASVIGEAVHNLFITEYQNDPIDTALQRLFDEISSFISNYFSTASSAIPKENVELYVNRKSVYLQSIQSIQEEESSHYKSLGDLYEDGDGLTEYLDNYVEYQDERKIKKFYFQKKNLENFVNDFVDSVDLFYSLLSIVKEHTLLEYIKLPEAKVQQYEQKALSQCQQFINDIWNALFNNIKSYVDYSSKLLGTNKRSLRKSLHKDLLSLGKSLAKVEAYLMDRQIKREEFRDLKLKTIELFLREIHNTFITEELAKVKFRESSFLLQDFEGNTHSEFMQEFTNALEQNIAEIQNLSVFKGFEPAKAKILANYFASIFMNFIKIMRKKLADTDAKPQDKDPNLSINILVALTNLKFMVDFYFEQMANKYCSDLNIYEDNDFREAIISKLKAFFPEQIKELKILYVKTKHEAILDIFRESLLSEVYYKKKFMFESKFIETYNQLILHEKEFLQIRYYVFDIMSQLVIAYDELLNYALFTQADLLKVIIEATASEYINTVKKITGYSKNVHELKQLWYEVEFFENATAKYKSEKSEAHFKAIYQEILRAKAVLENTDLKLAEMWTAREISDKKILIAKTKYKFQKQFECFLSA